MRYFLLDYNNLYCKLRNLNVYHNPYLEIDIIKHYNYYDKVIDFIDTIILMVIILVK